MFIHPFDHRDIVAGQGTLGLEILEQRPDVDTILVPDRRRRSDLRRRERGRSRRRRELGRTVRIIGVQAANAAAYPVSLIEGEPTEMPDLAHHRRRNRGQ